MINETIKKRLIGLKPIYKECTIKDVEGEELIVNILQMSAFQTKAIMKKAMGNKKDPNKLTEKETENLELIMFKAFFFTEDLEPFFDEEMTHEDIFNNMTMPIYTQFSALLEVI